MSGGDPPAKSGTHGFSARPDAITHRELLRARFMVLGRNSENFMSSTFLKLFGYLPSKVIDSINLTYNRVGFRKNIKNNIVVWKKYKGALTSDSSRAFRSLAGYESSVERYQDYLEGYVSENFQLISGDLDLVTKNDSLVMMCAVKNDLYRVKYQYEKMKQYGVNNFVYIDNGSTDGTKEWLAERDDVILYSTTQRFNSTIKSAWYKRIVDSIGYNRWYLYLDSDEVYMYPGIEEDKFQRFLEFFERKNISAIGSVLLDMYPRTAVSIHSSKTMPDLHEYCYFDPTYKVRHYRICKVFYGGPRYRVFGGEMHKLTNWLNKTNLVYYKKDFFQYAHHLVPHSLNFKAKVVAATLHYKFLPNDFDRIREIAEAGTYAGNSKEYKAYAKVLEDKNSLSFYCKDSVYLSDSSETMPDLDDYRYFDPTYKVRHYRICKVFYGGPRYRVFSDERNELNNWLNKTNLVYYKNDVFQYAHHLVPHSLNFRAKVVGATLHYKFLPNDFDRFLEIAESGTYAGNSKEYKAYAKVLKDKKALTFYCKDSVYLGDSSALERINVFDSKMMCRVKKYLR